MPRRSGSASTIIASRAVAREPRVARYLREIGVDAARVSRSDLFEEIAKPPSRADANVCGRERDLPAVRRQRDVTRRHAPSAANLESNWQPVGGERGVG